MKQLTRFCLGLFLLALYSCGGGKDTPLSVNMEHLIVPGQVTPPKSLRFSTLLEEYRYIIPEATQESMFAYISKAYIYQSNILIFDKKNQDKILVFNLNDGKFIRSIGRQGRGANEYISLGNFTLDKARGEVLILDEFSKKVLIYDAGSGQFKSMFRLEFTARNIEYLDENTLAYAGGGRNQDRLRLTDRAGKETGSWIPSNEKNWIVPLNSFSKGTGDEIIFRTYLSDTLYTVTPQGPVVSRFVDFGDGSFKWKEFMSYPESERQDIEKYLEKYRTNIKYYSETDNHIWFIFSDKGAPCCAIYNKETSVVYCYSMFTPNDVVFDKYAPLISASDENYFIGQNDAYSICDNMEQSNMSDVDIPDNIRNLSPYDNPVLTLLKFSKDAFP